MDIQFLKIENSDGFAVASVIERCSKTMLLRELVQNAIEAVRDAPRDQRTIHIRPAVVNGVPKLSIFNRGRGMDRLELEQMTSFHTNLLSHGKSKGLTENFGIGAKVASLACSPLGVRYRSRKQDCVCEITLCKDDDGRYGIRKWNIDDEYHCVTDITHTLEINSNQYFPSGEWTEVTLYGEKPDQATMTDPYAGDPGVDHQWILTGLSRRFYDLPDGVEIKVLMPGDRTKTFIPIPKRAERIGKNSGKECGEARYDFVRVPWRGKTLRIYWFLDGPYKNDQSNHNASFVLSQGSYTSLGCIVYKHEMYNVEDRWVNKAPQFGITYGGKHLSVHIELPDDFPVIPSADRTTLTYQSGEKESIKLVEFAAIVNEYLPDWVKEYIKKQTPDSCSDKVIEKRFRDMFDEIVWRTTSRVDTSRKQPNRQGMIRSISNATPERSLGATIPGNQSLSRKEPPQLHMLYDDDEIMEKELDGRAGKYIQGPNVLFVNMRYQAFHDAEKALMKKLPINDSIDMGMIQTMTRDLTEVEIISRMGRIVMNALVKVKDPKWDNNSIQASMSPEALSTVADSYQEFIWQVVGKVKMKMPKGPLSDHP